jgi:hypothetical protein
MKNNVNPTKNWFALVVGAAAIAGMAAVDFGSAAANAAPGAPLLPPDPCLVDACHTGQGHVAVPRLNPQPLPPGFRDRNWLPQREWR